MARTRGTLTAPVDSEDSELDLTVGVHTRISHKAEDLLKKRAKAEGIKAGTWMRQAIYRGLGLL